MSNGKLKPTSFEELREISQGELVELPPFNENHKFIARMRKPSLMVLLAENKIPNSLMPMIESAFQQGKTGKNSKETEQEINASSFHEMLEVLGRASFLEPTWDEIKESGVVLTYEQQVFIINYTQENVDKLETFRKQ